jgi:hypothetical protein
MRHVLLDRLCVQATIAVAVIVVSAACHAGVPLEFDRYSGLKSIQFEPGKCFRTHFDGERWWFVTPDGGAFLSLGAGVVNPTRDTERGTNRQPYRETVLAKYGSVENWTTATGARIKEWCMNSLGNWSTGELRSALPYTVELSVGSGLWGASHVPDFFDPKTLESIRRNASNVDS